MYKRILVATDGTELSDKAVDSAISLAALCGAELVALKVVPHYPQSYFEGSLPVSADDVAQAENKWTTEAEAVVTRVAETAQAKGVKAQGLCTKSDLVAEAIIAAAGKHECDLIIMASHGRRGISRLLLGSETQHVLTHSTIPVLVLR